MRVASAVQGALQSDAVVGMAGYLLAPAVGFVHDRLQFFDRQRGLRNQFAVLSHPGTMGHVNLDPVGAVVKLFARRLARLDRTVDDLRALGHLEFGSVAFEVVAAGGGNRAGDDEQPRPGDVAAFDRLLDSDVAIARAFSLEIAQRGEALLQRAPCRNRGPRRAKGQRIFQDVGVVAALRRVFSLQEDVSVGINQAGQHGGVREVDGGGAGRDFRGGSVRDAFNAVAANHDDLIAARLVGLAIDEHAGANDGDGRRGRSGNEGMRRVTTQRSG